MVPTTAATPAHFDKTFNINARGAYFTVQKALSILNDGGSIILIGSGVWLKGYPAYGTYSATKAALRSFVRTWTTELKDRKIRANVISPGAVETPIIDGQFPTKEAADGAREWFKSIIPLGRLGRPEEIASAALFLASDESSYVLGNDLVVDGGATAV
jgi:NAD(P)-dependent dehydrogenase (short-subunit alcohol dehydrogenase family)